MLDFIIGKFRYEELSGFEFAFHIHLAALFEDVQNVEEVRSLVFVKSITFSFSAFMFLTTF